MSRAQEILMQAIRDGDYKLVSKLCHGSKINKLRYGILDKLDVNFAEHTTLENGKKIWTTPLIEAIRSEKSTPEILVALIAAGANVTNSALPRYSINDYLPPLAHAIGVNKIDEAKILLAQGATIDAKVLKALAEDIDNNDGLIFDEIRTFADKMPYITMLTNGVKHKWSLKVLEKVIDCVDDINQVILTHGGSYAHLAVYNDNCEALRLLFSKGADLMMQDTHAQSPLTLAIKKSKTAAFNTLLELGVVPTQDDLLAASKLKYNHMVVKILHHGIALDAEYISQKLLEVANTGNSYLVENFARAVKAIKFYKNLLITPESAASLLLPPEYKLVTSDESNDSVIVGSALFAADELV